MCSFRSMSSYVHRTMSGMRCMGKLVSLALVGYQVHPWISWMRRDKWCLEIQFKSLLLACDSRNRCDSGRWKAKPCYVKAPTLTGTRHVHVTTTTIPVKIELWENFEPPHVSMRKRGQREEMNRCMLEYCYNFIQLDLNNVLLHRSYCLNCLGYAPSVTTRCTLFHSVTLHFSYMTRIPSC